MLLNSQPVNPVFVRLLTSTTAASTEARHDGVAECDNQVPDCAANAVSNQDRRNDCGDRARVREREALQELQNICAHVALPFLYPICGIIPR